MTATRVVLASLSAAMDGGFIAVADVSRAMRSAGAEGDYRLIGGTTVMLHVRRLQLDLALRATGDADFGVVPRVLSGPELTNAIEALGYTKVRGNRWERPIDGRRVATVDLLVPSYTSRARDTLQVGDVVTTEVPGLAEALRRPGVTLDVTLRLTDGEAVEATIVLPDAVSTLGLKARVRSRRKEARDAEDLWRCLEIAAADGVTPELLEASDSLLELRKILAFELGPTGPAMTSLTSALQPDAAARMRTRVRALLAEVVGAV